MDEQLKALLECINALRSGQEETKENMQRSQEETKERMEKGQEDLRNTLEKKSIAVEDPEKKLLASGNATNESKFVPASPVHVPSSAVPLSDCLTSFSKTVYL
ncbi:hypothetical protein TNCV_2767191 [Trichonephila clavipes]|nr:hypothetical protein TNCV_2767191 [Trichonephila clavipes]